MCLLMTGCQANPPGDIGVDDGARKVLDTVAGLQPQLNLALGDLAYQAGIEQEFCDMVKGKLGADFPYQVITGNRESNGSDGDIEKFVKCLPNRLPGVQGEYGTQWYVDFPAKDPLDSGGHAHAVPECGPLPVPGRQGLHQYADGQEGGPGAVRP